MLHRREATDPPRPSEDALRLMLGLEWQDHIQTRAQSWKALQIEALIAAAMMGVFWRSPHSPFGAVIAACLAVSAICGMAITIRHRDVELDKFATIERIEFLLGLSSICQRTHPRPRRIRWWTIGDPRDGSTSAFILRMHFLMLLFALAYLAMLSAGGR